MADEENCPECGARKGYHYLSCPVYLAWVHRPTK